MERNHICKKCGGIAGWDSYFQSWICTRCGNQEPKTSSNYDRIISKSPEELATLISENIDCGVCENVFGLRPCSERCCTDFWLGWLKQEADKKETEG